MPPRLHFALTVFHHYLRLLFRHGQSHFRQQNYLNDCFDFLIILRASPLHFDFLLSLPAGGAFLLASLD